MVEKYYSEKNIRKAQMWLRDAGSTIQVTGKYSLGMMSALVSFQRKNGLESNGHLDKVTWKLLKKQNSWWWKLFHKKVSK